MDFSSIGPLRHFIQQPMMPVLGLVIAAGAAKAGYGDWAAGTVLFAVSTYFGVAATAMLTRSLRSRVSAMRPHEKAC